MDIEIEDVDSFNKKIKLVIPQQDNKKEIDKYYKKLDWLKVIQTYYICFEECDEHMYSWNSCRFGI